MEPLFNVQCLLFQFLDFGASKSVMWFLWPFQASEFYACILMCYACCVVLLISLWLWSPLLHFGVRGQLEEQVFERWWVSFSSGRFKGSGRKWQEFSSRFLIHVNMCSQSFLTWLITYVHPICSSPMTRTIPMARNKALYHWLFVGRCDHSTLCVTVIRADLIETDAKTSRMNELLRADCLCMRCEKVSVV